ncbi:MAG: hypothetical protein IJW18_02200 [Lachnospiraceae bacterium]|nr:hypothetical protein [Lachnospiraceae bacterium]
MDESSNKMLTMIAGVILTLLVITAGFFIYTNAKDNMEAAINQMDELSNSMIESRITQYTGSRVSGRTVINAINYFYDKGEKIYITVKIGETSTTYLYSTDLRSSLGRAGISEAEDSASSTYINPMLDFSGSIERNATTKAIKGIRYEVID